MGSLNNILLELEEVDEIPEILYLEEKLHEVIVAVEVLDSKLDMLTYISITPAITKSLLKYLERKAMYAEEVKKRRAKYDEEDRIKNETNN